MRTNILYGFFKYTSQEANEIIMRSLYKRCYTRTAFRNRRFRIKCNDMFREFYYDDYAFYIAVMMSEDSNFKSSNVESPDEIRTQISNILMPKALLGVKISNNKKIHYYSEDDRRFYFGTPQVFRNVYLTVGDAVSYALGGYCNTIVPILE